MSKLESFGNRSCPKEPSINKSFEKLGFGFGMLTPLLGWFLCLIFDFDERIMFGLYFVASCYMIWSGFKNA
jgi:putative Mn2+ efflux pump MntP